MPVDLHTHTTYSDGTLTPTELLNLAVQKKLSAIAITDHDTVAGNAEALKNAGNYDVTVVPGLELSVDSHLPRLGHMHLVGLFIDVTYQKLQNHLEFLRRKRSERNLLILKKLTDLKCPLELNDLLLTSDDPSIGRPHIARAMVQKGYVKSVREAFLKYLKKGATAYMDKEKLHEKQAIQLIHEAGGIVILAHPVSLGYNSTEKLAAKIRKLKNIGLDGIEVYAPMNKGGKQDELLKIARDLDLQISGGSDFHGSTKPELDLGCSKVPEQVYNDLFKYWKMEKGIKA